MMGQRKLIKAVWTAISILAAISMVVYLVLPALLY